MSKPQVTLTFAGDATKLSRTFDEVGSSAKSMSDKVGTASKETGRSFDSVGERTDDVASKTGTASGAFGALASGVELSRLKAVQHAEALQKNADQLKANADELKKKAEADGVVTAAEQKAIDSAYALAEAKDAEAKKSMESATESTKLTTALMVGTLAFDAMSGASDLATLALKSNIVSKTRDTAVTVGQKTALIASTVATKAATAGQWALNVAMRANPIGLVITALTLLVGGIIIAYKKSETFRNIVQGAMKGVQTAFGWVVTKGGELLNWFKALPGKIGGFFKGIGGAVSAPFRAAFQAVKDFWNSTIGGKGFTVPGWVPKVGGKEFRIPYFHTGGIVSGAMGSETLAVLRAGERVTAGAQQPSAQQETGPIYLEAHIDLGDGVTKVVQVEMQKRDRQLKRTVKAA